MHSALYIVLFLFLSIFLPFSGERPVVIGPDSSVEQTLVQLGESPAPHQLNTGMEGVSAQRGFEIVTEGRTTKPKGGKTNRQSRHFVCTSCHNLVVEDPDLSVSDPQARLEYAVDNGLPFLQGTTLYGVVNRRSYYNGDYAKKYGEEEVKKARHDLREAIQLCAVGCAQGRALEDWEIESVLAYLWTLELKLGDLKLSDSEFEKLESALGRGGENERMSGDGAKTAVREMIHSKYLLASPATFTAPPADRDKGYGLTGHPENGELIYEHSCMHCHEKGRYSFYPLDYSRMSFRHLDYHMSRYTPYSLYQVGRYGTVPLHGKKSYMPQYTQEKMSDQQMEDLRAFIALRAK